jgi:peptidylprolyl isomerase
MVDSSSDPAAINDDSEEQTTELTTTIVTYPDDMITTTPSGLKYVVVREGIGARKPASGSVVRTHYCGWLGGFENKNKFDSSRDKGKEFTFQLGVGDVIGGWDEAVKDMKKKERRMIIVPPELGYGAEGISGAIPSKATLYFDIELLGF